MRPDGAAVFDPLTRVTLTVTLDAAKHSKKSAFAYVS
jgi:hypothetical protein